MLATGLRRSELLALRWSPDIDLGKRTLTVNQSLDGAVNLTKAGRKRGRKPAERNPLSAKVHELEAKVARLEKELHTAHTILDVQGKVAGLLGFSLEHGKDC